MTVLRGFVITIVSGCVFACVGGLLGYVLGIVAPDYYRAVLHIPPDMPIDPAQAGMGLGITQGCAAGLFVGLVIVVVVAWVNARKSAS